MAKCAISIPLENVRKSKATLLPLLHCSKTSVIYKKLVVNKLEREVMVASLLSANMLTQRRLLNYFQ